MGMKKMVARESERDGEWEIEDWREKESKIKLIESERER